MVATSYISKIFGRSPVAPLQEHISKVCECARHLRPFVRAVLDGDQAAIDQHRADISRLENEADELKKQIRLHLPNSLFMPVARADLLDILIIQDRIANNSKDISGLMVGRKMKLPEGFGAGFLELIEGSIAVVDKAALTIGELDELFETGFRGREAALIEGLVEELDALEKKTDRMQVELRATLFELEAELPPVDVMFYYKITDLAGTLADTAQRVGARLLLLLAK
jgi:predicted phosphate transport protein (TIGR00153 family)